MERGKDDHEVLDHSLHICGVWGLVSPPLNEIFDLERRKDRRLFAGKHLGHVRSRLCLYSHRKRGHARDAFMPRQSRKILPDKREQEDLEEFARQLHEKEKKLGIKAKRVFR